MQVEQIYTGCLAQGAYYIRSGNEAVIIDPLRETKPYIERAERDGVKIKYIFETHFHADFVSGHVDLSNKTGAKIVFGPNANCGYDCISAKDNEEFKVGDLTLQVLHTPGHTMESSCFLLKDEKGQPKALFTGDTLFIGDVGRPDLAVKSDLTQEDLAGMLYDSLRNKILPLPDDIIVYPGHGAGSACGKNMSKETTDTLGNQKKVNYALQNMTRDAFIKELTTGIFPAPQYFAKNAMLNKMGYAPVDEVMDKGCKGLTPEEFEQAANATEALILDVRSQDEFAQAHIPNSIFIGLNGQFAPWVGTLITDLKQPILLVAPEGKHEEAVLRLARVGYDGCVGFLKGGITAWIAAGKETDNVKSISATEFEPTYNKGGITVLDVRRPGEYDAHHLEDAYNRPLDFINEWMPNLEKEKEYYVHCAGGYRSMIAVSILKSRGIHKLIDVAGGFAAISKTGVKTTDFVCQSKKMA